MFKIKEIMQQKADGTMPGFATVLTNVFLCYGLTFLCLTVFAIIMTYTAFPAQLAPLVVLVLTALGVMLSGLLVARHGSAKGWMVGGIAGLVYMLTLYCIGSLVFRSITFGMNVVTMLLLGVLSGSFGGIVGINMKRKRKMR